MIRIVCADLAGADSEIYRRLYEDASPERKARADRYRRQEDSLRCVTADALLRYALGEAAGKIRQEKGCKPWIPGKPEVHFNLSHSGRWVVIAWGDGEVGVDVEQIREDTDIFGLARRYFTPEEQAYIREADSRNRFFALWTRKESYLKFQGTGLSKSPGSFSVLNGETGMVFSQRKLEGDYWLCLCSLEGKAEIEILDACRLAILGLPQAKRNDP